MRLLFAAAGFFTLILFPQKLFSQSSITLNEYVEKRLANLPPQNSSLWKLTDICAIDTQPIAERVFREYGAVFVATESVIMPPRCIFASEPEVSDFQELLKTEVINVGRTPIALQKAAALALKAAVDEAESLGKRITALDGVIAGRRNYGDTLRIWNSRFFRALDHWVAKGKITRTEANYAASLPITDQIKRVMVWE